MGRTGGAGRMARLRPGPRSPGRAFQRESLLGVLPRVVSRDPHWVSLGRTEVLKATLSLRAGGLATRGDQQGPRKAPVSSTGRCPAGPAGPWPQPAGGVRGLLMLGPRACLWRFLARLCGLSLHRVPGGCRMQLGSERPRAQTSQGSCRQVRPGYCAPQGPGSSARPGRAAGGLWALWPPHQHTGLPAALLWGLTFLLA